VDNAMPHDLWPVIGDATQLHQVLLNLCVNARDAMPQGGEIYISASNVELDDTYASMLPGATHGPNVLLEVRDTGSGIPEEIRERIFDPFFTTKELGKGTGLGLSTVVGIVKSHGGCISVASEVGVGTTFQIYLPAVREAHEAAADGASTDLPCGHGECILVVDDEEHVRKTVNVVLQTHGYTTLLAPDGIEALAIFAKHQDKVALVLTDLMMPRMDGAALIKTIRWIAPNIPIIASTGLGRKKDAPDLEQLKIKTLLTKPYGVESLLCAIRDALPGAASPPQI
jgi:CheY-like chemotaxis protein